MCKSNVHFFPMVKGETKLEGRFNINVWGSQLQISDSTLAFWRKSGIKGTTVQNSAMMQTYIIHIDWDASFWNALIYVLVLQPISQVFIVRNGLQERKTSQQMHL